MQPPLWLLFGAPGGLRVHLATDPTAYKLRGWLWVLSVCSQLSRCLRLNYPSLCAPEDLSWPFSVQRQRVQTLATFWALRSFVDCYGVIIIVYTPRLRVRQRHLFGYNCCFKAHTHFKASYVAERLSSVFEENLSQIYSVKKSIPRLKK